MEDEEDNPGPRLSDQSMLIIKRCSCKAKANDNRCSALNRGLCRIRPVYTPAAKKGTKS